MPPILPQKDLVPFSGHILIGPNTIEKNNPDCFTLFYTDGECRLITNWKPQIECQLEAGMVGIVPADMLYRLTPAAGTRITLLEITIKIWYHFLDDYALPDGELRRFLLLIMEKAQSDSGLFFEPQSTDVNASPIPILFETLYSLLCDLSPIAQWEAGHLFSLIMLRLQREKDYRMGYTRPLSQESYFVQYLYKEILKDITYVSLQDLADKMGISYGYLCRRFKKEAGRTIHEAITEIRMDMAVSYLKQPEIPISMIAELVGYTDETNFIRNFKKYYGTTPARYRRTK